MQRAEKRPDTVLPGKTDWSRIDAMTDDDIDLAIANDPDAAPALTVEEIRREYKPAPARITR